MANLLVSIIEEDAQKVVAAANLQKLAGKSILLTGASGLLGTYFLASLSELARQGFAPCSVTAVVYSEVSASLKPFLAFDGVRVIQGDLTDLNFVDGLGEFDFIIHAAGYGQPGRFMENQIKTLQLNTSTTLALFDRLASGGSFLFLSTSEVYSGLNNPPFREDQIGTTNTTHFRACYIEGKRSGEAICNAYRANGINANSARLALAYGPGTKPADRRVINSFIERGATQGKIILQDMGIAKRTYCYVSDAVEILWHILLLGREPIYNVGGFSRTTIAELAKKVGSNMNVPVEFPKDVQELGGAPEDVYLDMSLVQQEFKKTKYITLEEGLTRTIEWQKALYATGYF
ncbi:NAD-dependent epimerase/dehydratase family protein [Methylomonas sp. AM2-LC]|uniref:NAD-dependent epimerase/dehydratase family protein n=1 Tax=Methylomonas sp. AM2-LC TaxID=3153301 RepID=UPI00326792E7